MAIARNFSNSGIYRKPFLTLRQSLGMGARRLFRLILSRSLLLSSFPHAGNGRSAPFYDDLWAGATNFFEKNIQDNYLYDESDSEMAYNGAYEDEFARLQSESKAMSDEESRAFHSGERRLDEGVRSRLSGIIGRRLESGSGSRGYGDTSFVNEKTGNTLTLKTNVDAETFHDVFEIVQKYLENGDAVDVHGVADYEGNKNFLSKDGLSGFSITPDGDLISVFSMGERGFLRTVKEAISENGAKTLDCFDSPIQPLPKIYEKTLGFKTASVLDFNYELLKSEHGQAYADYFVKTYGESPVQDRPNKIRR